MGVASNCEDEMGCCCGPYPTIDLSEACITTKKRQRVASGVGGTEITNGTTTADKLKMACKRYGCFHVKISLSDDDSSSGLSILSDERKVKQRIESLFEDNFLSSIRRGSNRCQSDDSDPIIVSSFNGDCSVNNSQNNSTTSTLEARYRGRSAESGSMEKSSVEPKQSWELFRMGDVANNVVKDEVKISKGKEENTRLRILQMFVNALHKVADILCSEDLLDLPENKFICSSNPNNTNTDISLLRVFRYDALSTEEEQYSNLGSSSHTDWGSMTVVWQDSKGGLQMYCHKHQCWNDVKLEEEEKTSESVGDDGDSHNVRLFIHVGDYLSLAMNSISTSALDEKEDENDSGCNEESANGNHQNVIWPSPTHRVLCPLRTDPRSVGNDDNNSRCSLIYFAYPPNGVKMIDSISSLHGRNKEWEENSEFTTPHTMVNHSKEIFPFSRYMLLNNQSVSSNEKDTNIHPDEVARRILDKILHLPFNKVIEEKWNQVQRA